MTTTNWRHHPKQTLVNIAAKIAKIKFVNNAQRIKKPMPKEINKMKITNQKLRVATLYYKCCERLERIATSQCIEYTYFGGGIARMRDFIRWEAVRMYLHKKLVEGGEITYQLIES